MRGSLRQSGAEEDAGGAWTGPGHKEHQSLLHQGGSSFYQNHCIYYFKFLDRKNVRISGEYLFILVL